MIRAVQSKILVSGASEKANGQASGPILTIPFLVVLNHSTRDYKLIQSESVRCTEIPFDTRDSGRIIEKSNSGWEKYILEQW